MSSEFQLLTVVNDDAKVQAALTIDTLADSKNQEMLFTDFAALATMGTKPVVLDLRSVKFFEGTIPGKLLRLSEDITVAGGTLTVLAAPNICEVLKMLHLDRKFRVSDSDESAGLFKLP